MSDPNTHHDRDFVRSGVADAGAVSQWRRDFSAWLARRFAMDKVRHGDAILAVYEALANAAEFAYVGSSGTVTIEAHHDANDSRLSVTVRDHGTWRETVPTLRDNTRGRGIPLMKALADRATIERGPAGTVVRLQFDNIRLVDPEAFAESA